jgi:hypothetical protein
VLIKANDVATSRVFRPLSLFSCNAISMHVDTSCHIAIIRFRRNTQMMRGSEERKVGHVIDVKNVEFWTLNRCQYKLIPFAARGTASASANTAE